MTRALWISRICDEFPCYGPVEAERAWLSAPPGWIEEVIETRAYVRIRTRVREAKTKEDVAEIPASRLKDLAIAFMVDEPEEEQDTTPPHG